MTYEELEKVNKEMKTTDIKGKDYAEVNQRIKAFRKLHPNGCIDTKIESLENGVCIIRAFITDEEGNLLGTGTAYEKEGSTFINKTSYIENCETSAVGRALGMLGIGIDVSVASYEEVANAIKQQTEPKDQEPKNQEPSEEEMKALGKKKISETKVKALKSRCEKENVPVEKVLNLYKVKEFAQLSENQFANIHNNWEKIKAM